jgi:hypothetical protein
MPTIAIVGTLAAGYKSAIRQNLTLPRGIVVSDETGIVSRLADIDMLLTRVMLIAKTICQVAPCEPPLCPVIA